jgi:hypothetical protein
MLGEERWIDERPMDVAMAVNGVGLLLMYWELLARYHDRQGAALRRF